jgi:hypothetical protein
MNLNECNQARYVGGICGANSGGLIRNCWVSKTLDLMWAEAMERRAFARFSHI